MVFDWKKYSDLIRQTAAGGCVLLKNDDGALPLRKDETVSIFGRIQMEYYNAGAGSGGMVNVPYISDIPDALRNSGVVSINEELFEKYAAWKKENPFDNGTGSWATEPYCQKEMPLTKDDVDGARKVSETAIIIIGRLAGEDKDALPEAGSYYLQPEEEEMLSLVCAAFPRTVVLLNVGGIMDMSWVKKYNPSSVMYLWQGGMEGGNAAADVLCGKVSPSGHLADTIAEKLEDYPAHENYGDEKADVYAEDIYVGYRYFESAAKDKVLYPFGWGLSYTDFDISCDRAVCIGDPKAGPQQISFSFTVKNIGKTAGRSVVQLYVKPPSGKLQKPARVLAGFAKTPELSPGGSCEALILVDKERLASYDDDGRTGNRACFVLEAGEYEFFAGENVRDARSIYSLTVEKTAVAEQCESALMPVAGFERMCIDPAGDIAYERVPVRDYDIGERIEREKPGDALPYSGDRGLKLKDAFSGKCSVDEFLAQLSDEDLICMTRMEGVYSPRCTPGTVGAFGGVTDSLQSFGIPAVCCTDGPSGIRMDDGSMAYSLPSGTLMACSFDTKLVEELYAYEGLELRMNHIEALLGPGINIHRYPLNGRNFEYFSEDPYLTGVMAAAQLHGMARAGTTGTVKHFAANNQEKSRTRLNSVVSERALREIYLKPFEIAVKKGGAYSIMSTYGALNGTYTAGNSDLLTVVLRDQWHFDGAVMTDWWAMVNDELSDGEAAMKNAGAMIRAQGDLYSVHRNSESNTGEDDIAEWLGKGLITRAYLVRSAKNILSFIRQSALMTEGEPISGEINRPEYDGRDKNRKIDLALQSPPPGCE